MTNRDTPPVKLGYEVDSASEARVKASTASFVAQLKEMATSGEGVSTKAQQLTRQIIAEFEKQNSSVKATVASETAELQKLQAGFDQTGAAAKRGLNVEGLRRTGGALSQLGAGEVGGAVSRAGDIAQIAKEFSGLGLALPPLAIGLGAVTAATALYNESVKATTERLDAADKAQRAYLEALRNSTTNETKAKLQALTQQRDIDQQLRDFQIGQAQKALKEFGPLSAEFANASEKIKNYNSKLVEENAVIDILTNAIKDNAFWVNDLANTLNNKTSKAIQFVIDLSKKVAEEQAKLGAALRLTGDKEIERIKIEQRTNNELLSFTYEQAQARMKAIEDEKAINDKIILTRGLVNAQLDRNSDEYKRNAVEMAAATEANKNLNTELNALKNGLDNLPAEIDAANQRIAAVTKKYNDERSAIEQRSNEERANIETKYQDKLIDIVRNTANAIDEATRNLQRQNEDNAISFDRATEKAGRDTLAKQQDIQLKGQVEESKALRDHLRNLERIRAEAADREFELIANRDFAGLFMSRRQTSRDMERTNKEFTDQVADRRAGLQQQFDDLKRSIERERQERVIAANQQIEDNRRAFQRALQDEQRKRQQELQLAGETRNKDLQNLASKTAAELRLKQQSYDAELRMAAQYGKARVDMEANIQKALLAQANARLAALTGGTSGGTFMTQNTTNTSSRTVNVNATGFGMPEIQKQINNSLRQVFT